ncbi:hypothetical protein PIROE2DRAFT_10486 [Piromyces sp. E2]|nr:hypothetical protein PIROE2DRAFT_10486 [Piromyces sp. E2]|eukprot:OUM63072.1 hypothetical protein PIROE2DRAFT_10486 [Piromyces sp. E2]
MILYNNKPSNNDVIYIHYWIRVRPYQARLTCAALSLADLRGLIATMVSLLENGHMVTYVTAQRH